MGGMEYDGKKHLSNQYCDWDIKDLYTTASIKDIILKHVISPVVNTGIVIDKIALDAGYNVSAVHRA